jgi:hypothetical protein
MGRSRSDFMSNGRGWWGESRRHREASILGRCKKQASSQKLNPKRKPKRKAAASGLPPVDLKEKRFITSLNHVQSSGRVIKNPRIIYQLKVDGRKVGDRLGGFDTPSQDLLDYIIYKEEGLTLGSQDDFYKKHRVEITAWYVTGQGAVKQAGFRRQDGQWVKEKEREIR